MKIPPVGAEFLFHADGRTDRYDENNSCFPQFLRKRPSTIGNDQISTNRLKQISPGKLK